MGPAEVEKAKALIVVEIIEYVPNSVVIKSIIKKTTGNISAVSFDAGEGFTARTSPFDTFVQIIDGEAEITIAGTVHHLVAGQMIIMPANRPHALKAVKRFKMLLVMIRA